MRSTALGAIAAFGLLPACGGGPNPSVPWTLSGIGRDGRTLRLTYFPTTPCDRLPSVRVDEEGARVTVGVRVAEHRGACIAVLPRPGEARVVLRAPLGDRELVHARARTVPLPGRYDELRRRERALLSGRG